ncbi:unnamed protein product [Pedinophyceae sp. YPF-701]|nr:unnamed protein product [Pedinophyceae sp. YPF-701]
MFQEAHIRNRPRGAAQPGFDGRAQGAEQLACAPDATNATSTRVATGAPPASQFDLPGLDALGGMLAGMNARAAEKAQQRHKALRSGVPKDSPARSTRSTRHDRNRDHGAGRGTSDSVWSDGAGGYQPRGLLYDPAERAAPGQAVLASQDPNNVPRSQKPSRGVADIAPRAAPGTLGPSNTGAGRVASAVSDALGSLSSLTEEIKSRHSRQRSSSDVRVRCSKLAVGTLACSESGWLAVLSDRLTYKFRHPRHGTVEMVMYARDITETRLDKKSRRLSFRVRNPLELFLGSYDPDNPAHRLCITISAPGDCQRVLERCTGLLEGLR